MSPILEFESLYRDLALRMTQADRDRIDTSTNTSKSYSIRDTDSPSFKPRGALSVLKSWQDRLDPQEVEHVMERTADIRSFFYPTGDDPMDRTDH